MSGVRPECCRGVVGPLRIQRQLPDALPCFARLQALTWLQRFCLPLPNRDVGRGSVFLAFRGPSSFRLTVLRLAGRSKKDRDRLLRENDPGLVVPKSEAVPEESVRLSARHCHTATLSPRPCTRGVLSCMVQMPQGQTPAQTPQPMQRSSSET